MSTNSLPRIRWGVVGLGRFGAIHAKVLASLPDVELVAFCTRREERLQTLADEFGVKMRHTSARELFASSVDAVTIATHWHDHAELACEALASGKHVLLEKPMAPTTALCRRILNQARRAPGYLMVGHVCRFDPRVTLARQAVLDGRLGRIFTMRSRRNLPFAPGALRLDKISPLMGDGVHDADLMMWLLGRPPDRVSGRVLRVEQFRYPDVGWATLDFGDAVGQIEVNWRLPPQVPTGIDAELELVGTLGMLRVSCGHAGLAVQDAHGYRTPDTVYWPEQYGSPVGALAHEISYFAKCIRERRAPEAITPLEAARAVAVMEGAEESAILGHEVKYDEDWTG